ncbi:uncharacterized protein LOC143289912 [Babylonia areolata]|uniref:uncharacterized protein LOC143289912 n=1 Tax=Babylonia areolata TaxID=304850 RepID=UPI003FD5881E
MMGDESDEDQEWPKVWVCEECDRENEENENKCPHCGTGKPYGTEPAQDQVKIAKQEIEQLIKKVCKTCGEDDGTVPPRKICFVGRPGAGKSSVVNSIAARLGDGWYPYAPQARFSKGRPKTIHIKRFQKCCMDMETDRVNRTVLRNREKYSGHLLPTLIDVAGLDDEAGDAMKKFLTLLMYGHVKNSSKAINVYENCKIMTTAELHEAHPERYEDMKLDVLVFVASVSEELPINLMECVADIASASHNQDAAHAIPVFGILTKKDEVDPDSEEVMEKLETFKQTLGIDDNNFLFCSCYCDKLFPKDAPRTKKMFLEEHGIVIPLLKLLNRMCNPYLSVIEPDEPLPLVITHEDQVQVEEEKQKKEAEKMGVKIAGPAEAVLQDIIFSFIFTLFLLALMYFMPLDRTLQNHVKLACDADAINGSTTTIHRERLCRPSQGWIHFSTLLSDAAPLLGAAFVLLLFLLPIRRLL